MPFVEQAGLPDKIAKLVTLKTQIGPANFCNRACPRLWNEGWRKLFAKWPIKAGIVSNDKVGCLESGDIDFLARDHLIGDTGQTGDLRRNGDEGCRRPL